MMILSTRTAIWLRVGNDDHDLGPEMDGPCNDKKCGRGGDIYVCVHIHARATYHDVVVVDALCPADASLWASFSQPLSIA